LTLEVPFNLIGKQAAGSLEFFRQRRKNYLSIVFLSCSTASTKLHSPTVITKSMGSSLQSFLRKSVVYLFDIGFSFQGRKTSDMLSLTSFSSIGLRLREAALIRQAVAILLIWRGTPTV
jgi:hypothetical protein